MSFIFKMLTAVFPSVLIKDYSKSNEDFLRLKRLTCRNAIIAVRIFHICFFFSINIRHAVHLDADIKCGDGENLLMGSISADRHHIASAGDYVHLGCPLQNVVFATGLREDVAKCTTVRKFQTASQCRSNCTGTRNADAYSELIIQSPRVCSLDDKYDRWSLMLRRGIFVQIFFIVSPFDDHAQCLPMLTVCL